MKNETDQHEQSAVPEYTEKSYFRSRKEVEQSIAMWQGAEQFITRQSGEDQERYEQAVGMVLSALQFIPSLEALCDIHHLYSSQEYQHIEAVLRQACPAAPTKRKTERQNQLQPLQPHFVENAAFYRRSKQLFSQWWVRAWNRSSTPITHEQVQGQDSKTPNVVPTPTRRQHIGRNASKSTSSTKKPATPTKPKAAKATAKIKKNAKTR